MAEEFVREVAKIIRACKRPHAVIPRIVQSVSNVSDVKTQEGVHSFGVFIRGIKKLPDEEKDSLLAVHKAYENRFSERRNWKEAALFNITHDAQTNRVFLEVSSPNFNVINDLWKKFKDAGI
ncbi:hypothetical protein HY994_03205 [Candidatus Micrarchaeota archaeon]|nr:hypothetical protein [Candidatus Micrarchaeota archaeon]